jgi:hypothetical protein
MAIADDLNSSAELCANAADAATTKLIDLGPRPADPAAAAVWDHQDTLLKNNISVLNNVSSTLSAVIVSNALQQVWPNLQGLSDETNSAQGDINAIADISKAMVKLASIIDFGVAVVALAAQPTPGSAGAVVTAFGKMIAS